MKTTKRLLTAALALMMVLSVMVTASATTFKDDAKISADYKEAVEVLTGMKVINGVGDEFLPQDYLNREAAAKIVAYILEGSGNTGLGSKCSKILGMKATIWVLPRAQQVVAAQGIANVE